MHLGCNEVGSLEHSKKEGYKRLGVHLSKINARVIEMVEGEQGGLRHNTILQMEYELWSDGVKKMK